MGAGAVAAPQPPPRLPGYGIDLPAESRWSIAWPPLLLLSALIVLLYHGIAVKLVTDWHELPDFGHGYLIPFFAAFLLWDKRDEFLATPLAPSWGGIVLVALGLFELLVGRLGADLFLQRTSFILLVAGIIWTLLGRQMLGRGKFILFVLLLAIPLPTIVFNQITFPLQLMASRFASDLLSLAQVPVLQEGNIIQLPAMPLEVAEACSGIRSLMSLFTVAVIYGYFLERATWRRVVLALSSLPIAVTANVARIFGTGLCVQYWDPVKALGFFHEFSGWLIFVVCLCCLYLVHIAMNFAAGRESAAGRQRSAA
ncbi:MAG TPA: exosortase/archaeosortase family protein [Acidobacteriaceae bacterium]|nr:exosortase/archaeosortase family protein [Acidobacteriaceae bacterium]